MARHGRLPLRPRVDGRAADPLPAHPRHRRRHRALQRRAARRRRLPRAEPLQRRAAAGVSATTRTSHSEAQREVQVLSIIYLGATRRAAGGRGDLPGETDTKYPSWPRSGASC
jgi:hypothetical protein